MNAARGGYDACFAVQARIKVYYGAGEAFWKIGPEATETSQATKPSQANSIVGWQWRPKPERDQPWSPWATITTPINS